MTKHVLKRMIGVVLCLCLLLQLLPQAQNVLAASSKVETALDWAQKIADDNSHGYSQQHRNGPDYDCSSYVSTALVKAGLNDNGSLTTYTMKKYLCSKGFTWIPWSSIGGQSGLKRGDILLDEDTHTEFYIGNGKMIGAHRDYGYPATGDQTGKEISVQSFYNNQYGISWNGVLRYEETNPVTTTPSIWKNSDSYTVGNSATLTWNSVDNATGYWFSVWYKGEQIVTTQVSGSSEYTLNNLGEGEYTAYITAYNDSSSKQGYVTFRVNYVSGEQTIPNGRYQICSALDNSSVISISGASTDDEANVLLYANERHDNQYFDFEYLGNGYYKITAKHSGKVLDVYWEKMEAGANVQQYYWNNGDNQQWVVKDAGDGYFYIISKSNSLYMDVYGGVASNDVNIDTYTGHGGTSEKWKLIPAGEKSVADGKYQICTALDDSSVISISEASKDACANALLYANENHKNQVFNFEYQWDGYYKIIARHSGMALDVYNSEQSSGANVEQYPWKNSDNQKWVVKPAGDGYYYIVSKGNGLYLDVYGGVAVNDANIDTYFGHGGASEKWRLIPVNEPENLLTVKGCSVSLKENIGVNMYASFSDDILEDDGAKVRFTYADNSYIEVPLSNYMSTTYNNENVKKITFDTVPAKLTEKIKVSVIKSDDTQTNMFSFSTSDYLYALINSTDKSIGANQKNIAKALLNYGAYSQIYFGVDTADLANKKLTDNTVEKTDSDTVIKSIQGQENGLFSNRDFEYIGSSLVCDSSTDLKLYFVNKSRLTMKQIENQYDISVANKNTHGFDVGTDGNILWIKVKDLRPNELEEMYSVRILSDDGSVIVETSPSVYIKKALLSEDVKLENLCKAMWMYGQAVRDYGK